MSTKQSEHPQTSTNKQKEKQVSLARLRTRIGASPLRRPAHRRGDETGFSLIELMIVLLIIAILLAVAIPTYLSARNRAEDRAAQETLAHVNVSAMSDYASQGSFTPLNGAATMDAYLTSQNPGVTVSSGGSSGAATAVNEVSLVSGAQYLSMADWAADGKCFFELNIESTQATAIDGETAPGTYFAEGKVGTTYPGCYAGEAPTSATGWYPTWSAAAAG